MYEHDTIAIASNILMFLFFQLRLQLRVSITGVFSSAKRNLFPESPKLGVRTSLGPDFQSALWKPGSDFRSCKAETTVR